jgi:UDP:flavonoid glycosyltransferase YjiC (YdhE family)
VRAAVQQVLDDPGFRIRAEDIGRSLAAHGGATTAASLIEQLADSRRPVLRSHDPW